MTQSIVPADAILRRIRVFRGQKVLLDADLSTLYGVETKALVQAVTRNIARFPEDFMFRLTHQEFGRFREEMGEDSSRGGRRYPPYAFTEQGVAMLSSVLRSERAVAVNIEIMRAFVSLRRMLQSHEDLVRRLEELESKYDSQFASVFEAIRQLMAPPDPKARHPIGFAASEDAL